MLRRLSRSRNRSQSPAVSMTKHSALLVATLVAAASAAGQGGYIDQDAVAELLNHRSASIDLIPDVFYEYHVLENERGNDVLARNSFYRIIGNGNTQQGLRRAELVHMINRLLMRDVHIGDTIIVPTRFDLDFRAYSPFPRYYTGGRDFDKLFIMDKTIQAFAAYEYGRLMRWGIINTGNPDESPTPNGRFNFNWKEPYRVSTLSPPGEEWEMYWVVNFHLARGMHVHQYEMPTGGPMSHGCVRLVDADAEWLYNWVDTWKTSSGNDDISSITSRLITPGTTVLVIGTEPGTKPEPFLRKERYPELKRVELPTHPHDVPPGTIQQKRLDALRLAGS